MSEISQKTDQELVAASLADPDQFYHLMARYENRLLRYIRSLTNVSAEEAEDILQEVFIKVYRNLNDFDPDLKFSSWIYRITHNEVISNHRKNKARAPQVALETESEDEGDLLAVLADDEDLAETFSQKEISGQIRSAIASLPIKYKEVLVLRYLEERDYNEIADILQKPSGTVATLLNRAKKQLRAEAQKRQLDSYL